MRVGFGNSDSQQPRRILQFINSIRGLGLSVDRGRSAESDAARRAGESGGFDVDPVDLVVARAREPRYGVARMGGGE